MSDTKYIDNSDDLHWPRNMYTNYNYRGFGLFTNSITIPTFPVENDLIGISTRMNGVSSTGIIDSGSRKVSTSPSNADKVGLKGFPSSVEQEEVIHGVETPHSQQIIKYHLPNLEIVGVGLFHAKVNIKQGLPYTLIPSGLLCEHYTLNLHPNKTVTLTDKVEGIGIPFSEKSSKTFEDFWIPNHIVSIGSYSFNSIFDSGFGVCSVTPKIASETNLKKYPKTPGTNEGEGYRVPIQVGPYITEMRVDILDSFMPIISVTDLLKKGFIVRLHEKSTEFVPGRTFF
jgi:hypothetical protein